MSKIRVNTDVLQQQQQQLEQLARELENISGEVAYVKTNLSWQISSRAQIQKKLGDYSNYIGTMQKRTSSLSSVMQSVSEQYQATEKKLGAVSVQQNSQQENTSKEKESQDAEASFDWSKIYSLLWSVLGKAGIVGSVISLIGQLLTGGKSVKNVLKGLKNLSSLIGSIGKATSEPSFDWKTLFGGNKVIIDATPKNFVDAFDQQIEKLSLSGAKTVGDKVSVIAKWAGFALTGILTAYDNFTDKENTTVGRKLAETIGETSVKITEGIALTALATSALATLGFGAPAIVVGGVVVVATWGIDRISEAITGKDFAEAISDFYLDNGKKLIDRIGAKAKKTGDKIKGWWDELTGKNRWASAY